MLVRVRLMLMAMRRMLVPVGPMLVLVLVLVVSGVGLRGKSVLFCASRVFVLMWMFVGHLATTATS